MNKKGLCMLLAAALVFAAALPLMPRTAAADDTKYVDTLDAAGWADLCANAETLLAGKTNMDITLNEAVVGTGMSIGLVIPASVETLSIKSNLSSGTTIMGYLNDPDSTQSSLSCILENISIESSAVNAIVSSYRVLKLTLDGICSIKAEGGITIFSDKSCELILGEDADVTIVGGIGNGAAAAAVYSGMGGDLIINFGDGSKLTARSGAGNQSAQALYSWKNIRFLGNPAQVLIEDGVSPDTFSAMLARGGSITGDILDSLGIVPDMNQDNYAVVNKVVYSAGQTGPDDNNDNNNNDDNDNDSSTETKTDVLDDSANNTNQTGSGKLDKPLEIPVMGGEEGSGNVVLSASYDSGDGSLTVAPTQKQFFDWLESLGSDGNAVFDTSFLLSGETTMKLDPQWILDLFDEGASDEMKALAEKFQTLTVVNRNGGVTIPASWLALAAEYAEKGEMIEIYIGTGSVIFKVYVGGKAVDLKVTAPATLSMKFTPAKGRSPESYTLRSKDTAHTGTFANYEGGMLTALVYETGHYDIADNTTAPAYIPDSAVDAFLSYKVSASVLNLRKGGSMSFDVIGKLPRGTVVVVEYLSGNWAYIHTDSGTTGWVYSKYLTAL